MKPMIPGRLHAQGLTSPLGTPADVVRHLGCVQSQLPDMALWAIARRVLGRVTLAELRSAFDRGDFIRTHVLRPTWHYVAPADIGWLLALTAPRIRQSMAAAWGAMGLNRQIVDRGAAVLAEAVADGVPRTRTELATVLASAGLDASGQFLVHQLMHAEIEGALVSGPTRGGQHTYTRVPPREPVPPREELLARVAHRYGRGHGAFRVKDLAWWTSLTITDSRRAVQLAQLRPLEVHGESYWVGDEPVLSDPPSVMLMSNFDEYISYARDPQDYELFAGGPADVMRGGGLLMIDGRLRGTWARTITARTVRITVARGPDLTAGQRRSLDDEVAAFGRFVEREPQVFMTC